MTIRSFCVHAHFYQPPREDPITGYIPREPGATPYNNWNERIHAECYRPNAELRNFEHISFNIGPTLSRWMDAYDPQTSQMILAQDQSNLRHYGVGNAIAQSYNHTILPLASYRDKVTQVAWGIADFKHRYGRKPQGMWLPETAADTETLQVLAKQGIEFTILAPWQAAVDPLDTTEPYRVFLPDGQSITVFFYHQELSTRISFDPGSTINADTFISSQVLPYFRAEKTNQNLPQMLTIASDGELYGHHQKFRDRFLARLMDGAVTGLDIHATFPALWLKDYPAKKIIGIREKTSWSCHHGVKRWMGACDCTPGDGRWKYFLRHAFDHLAVSLDRLYIESASPYFSDPWDLRNRYIHVMLAEIGATDLLQEVAGRALSPETIWRVQLLLEAQQERQRMFTSCGWFFEDFSRIEPKNNVAYAAQAVRLARIATGVDLAPQVLADLKHVVSNRSGLRGDTIFQRQMARIGYN